MIAARTLRPLAAAALLAGLVAPLRAEPTKPAVTWDPARTSSPETVDELRALQEKVKQVVAKVTPSTVGLLVGMGAGSGVIVSEDGLILTAAHVIGSKPGTRVRIVLADGTLVRGKTLGVNPKRDSGMVRITDKVPEGATWPGASDGKWPAAEIGKSDDLKKGQWVIAMGHPGGPKRDRRPPVRVGRFDRYNKHDSALRTDCTLVGGDSGGPLFDLTGKVVGIHSRIGIFLEFNMHVPTEAFRDDWDKLVEGKVIGKPSAVELGLTLDDEAESATVKAVAKDGPAAKAGVKPGDVITKFHGERVHTADDLLQLLPEFAPGDTVNLEIQRGDEIVSLKVKLARRAPKRDRKPDE
ncbi:MAG TPA: trypsin-like peptidase domain-containing protein [Fimbriiglobus sp.]|nr:trypsin-like peptidase domain-containing protein [Fimbriiglobus sp.]